MDQTLTVVDTPIQNIPASHKYTTLACFLDPIQNTARKIFANIDKTYDRFAGKIGHKVSYVLLGLGSLTIQSSYLVAMPLIIGGLLFGYLNIRNSTLKLNRMIDKTNTEYENIQKECEKIYKELINAKLVELIKNSRTPKDYNKNIKIVKAQLEDFQKKFLFFESSRDNPGINFANIHLLTCGIYGKAIFKSDLLKSLHNMLTGISKFDFNKVYTNELHLELIQLIEEKQSDEKLETALKIVAKKLNSIKYDLFYAEKTLFIKKLENESRIFSNVLARLEDYIQHGSIGSSKKRAIEELENRLTKVRENLDENQVRISKERERLSKFR
jgi:hypothetical protein